MLSWQGIYTAGTCAGERSVRNFPSMIWRNRLSFLCALTLSSALSAWAQDTVDSDIRPTGVNGPVRKAKAVTHKSADHDTETDAPKATKPKWRRPRPIPRRENTAK